MRQDDRNRFAVVCVSLVNCALLLAPLLIYATGCNNSSTTPSKPLDAGAILDRVVAVYQQAARYADSGEVRLHYTLDGRVFDQTFPWSITFERPNKLRAHLYGATVVCDGKDYWSILANLRQQVVRLTAPAVLTPDNVYATPVLVDQMTQQVASGSVALAFLLDENPLAPVLYQAELPRLVPAQTIDQNPCYGVLIRRKDGDLVLWIDQANFTLRRIDYPLVNLQEALGQQGKIGELSLTADLRGAQLDPIIDPAAFQFEPPADAKLVKEFEVIRQPEPPTRLLGSKVPDFSFRTLDDKPIDRKSLAGKVAVLAFWATWGGEPVFESLPHVQRVYEKYRENDRVTFLAVSIDRAPGGAPVQASSDGQPTSIPVVTDQQIRETFSKASLVLPLARDPSQQAYTVLGVIPIPSLLLIGADGTIEDQIIGVDPKIPEFLPERIEKLLAGGSLHAETLARYQAEQRRYEAQFQDPAAQPPRAEIAKPSQPQVYALRQLWSCAELKEPGNVLVVTDAGATRVFVNDAWTSVVELDGDGKLVARHDLDLPKDSEAGVVTYLRTAVDSTGVRWFAGCTRNGKQVHVFDAEWKRLFSYPEGASAAGIADVQFGDLDGDGQLELNVSYYDVVGVHNLDLKTHRRRWNNRSLANVMSMAVTRPDAQQHRALWCANEQGTIVPIDFQGLEGAPIRVGDLYLRLLHAADLAGQGKPSVVAVAFAAPANDTLLGLDAAGRQQWSYPLPAGLQPIPSVEMIAAGPIVGASTQGWIVAGADGSIHLLTADGVPIDRWNHGEAISGIAAAALAQPAIIVSSGKTVQAIALDPAANKP